MEAVFGYSDGLIPVRSFIDKGQGFDGRPSQHLDRGGCQPRPTRWSTSARLGRARGRRRSMSSPVRSRSPDKPGRPTSEQMQTVVVDLDTGDIAAARAHLERHLGPPTMVVESGGVPRPSRVMSSTTDRSRDKRCRRLRFGHRHADRRVPVVRDRDWSRGASDHRPRVRRRLAGARLPAAPAVRGAPGSGALEDARDAMMVSHAAPR